MPDIRQTTEYRATQLVYSIKFKLSHAMCLITSVICELCPRKIVV